VPPARWSPTYTPNGWYPKLSYPWVAHGFAECWLSNIVTGETRRIRGDVRCQAAGWLNDKEVCYYRGELPAHIETEHLDTGVVRPLAVRMINRVVARNGSWATGYAESGTVTFNGTEVAHGVGWRVDVDGAALVCQANDGLHVWVNGQPKPTLIPKATLVDPQVRGDHVGYGYSGNARVVDLRSGQDDDVTVAPWRKENGTTRIDGWIWTTTEKPDGTSAAIGRPVGATDCLVFPVESAVGLDVQRVGAYWVVATYGSQGQLVVQSARVDAPRVPLAPPAPPSPVVVPPAPAHLTMCGYFFRDTNIHAYVAKYGGENKEAPGTHSIIVDDHGMPAETRRDGTTPRMIVGLSQLLHPQLEGWWQDVDAVYVAKEGDEDGLRSLMDLARYIMAYRHLAPKPILTYSGREVFPNVHRPTDILGIQLYAEQGTDGVRNLREQAAWYRAKTAHVPRVAIIGQAFDRSVGWTGAQLAAMQPELYALACEWPNCEGLFWFSDSRTGGTRDHEEMRPWHVAITAAISQR
jgi:hypothetical protein